MSIFTAIMNKNETSILSMLKADGPNYAKDGYTPLWIALNGSKGKPQYKDKKYASYEIVELLLQNKCCPNMKCLFTTPLYLAIFHDRCDIARLLLEHGASPNEFSLIKCDHKTSTAKMFMPLCEAIINYNVPMVELLVEYDCWYNKITLSKLNKMIKKIKLDYTSEGDHKKLLRLKKINKILKTNYNDEKEKKLCAYFAKYMYTGKFKNIFKLFVVKDSNKPTEK